MAGFRVPTPVAAFALVVAASGTFVSRAEVTVPSGTSAGTHRTLRPRGLAPVEKRVNWFVSGDSGEPATLDFLLKQHKPIADGV